jgi:putative transposase
VQRPAACAKPSKAAPPRNPPHRDRGTPIASRRFAMSRPPRLQGFTYRGRHVYFLTFCTHARRDTFRDPSVATMVIGQMLRAAARFAFAVLAYCVMPDHVHLLAQGKSDRSDLRRFVRHIKQVTAQTHHTKGPMWQEGYYDHVVRPEEDVSGIARYIVENPIRARLVNSTSEYAFIGSDVWSIEEILRRDSVVPGPRR